MAAALTQKEEQIVRHFMEVVNRKEQCLAPVSWSTAVKFLYARKFDVKRAVELYEQHEATRCREGLTSFDPTVDPLKSELETEKFTILPTRDATGAAIAVFTARIHSPQVSTHQTTLQGIVYQLDVALESIETQKAGVVFIYDMSDSKYSNFDYDLSKKILMLLREGYPAKLKKVLIVTAPLWFKAPFKILRLFVQEKLRNRVFTVSIPQLTLHIPRESLPSRLGGTLTVAHDEWLLHCHKTITNKNNEENGMACASTPAPNGTAFNSKLNSLEEYSDGVNNHSHFTENEGEDSQKTGNKTSQLWQDSSANHAGETSPQLAASSASSGFSDDECLHNEASQTLDINQFIECILQKGKAGLVAEYLEIKTRPPCGTFEEAKKPCNAPKNRYSDVLCYDHSRVVLSQVDGEEGSTYINANFVDGYKQKNAFISTQGPLPRTSADFWRMVWEQHVLVIAMTTRCSEKTRNKCYCYWPEEEISEELTYGQFRITNCSVEKFNDFVISKLQITNLDTDETRDVTHYQYVSWPDYGVPKASELLEFIREVREGQENMLREVGDKWAGHSRGPPIVVHCSAGIGRTGSFCTLDISLSRLEDTGLIDVRGTVEKIRSQRAHSIQMPEQYIFCHTALIEFAYIKGVIDTLPDLSMFEGSVADDHD